SMKQNGFKIMQRTNNDWIDITDNFIQNPFQKFEHNIPPCIPIIDISSDEEPSNMSSDKEDLSPLASPEPPTELPQRRKNWTHLRLYFKYQIIEIDNNTFHMYNEDKTKIYIIRIPQSTPRP